MESQRKLQKIRQEEIEKAQSELILQRNAMLQMFEEQETALRIEMEEKQVGCVLVKLSEFQFCSLLGCHTDQIEYSKHCLRCTVVAFQQSSYSVIS